MAEEENKNLTDKGDLHSGSWTLHDVIAHQEQYLRENAPAKVSGPEQPEAEGSTESKPAEDAKPATATVIGGGGSGKTLTLQEIIAQQRAALHGETQEGKGDDSAKEASQDEPAASGNSRPESPAAEPVAASANASGEGVVVSQRNKLVPLMLIFNTFVLVLVLLVSFNILPPLGAEAIQIQPMAAIDNAKDASIAFVKGAGGVADVEESVAGPWQLAEKAYRGEQWDEGMRRYRFLMFEAKGVPADELVGQFFKIRVAECLMKMGRGKEGRKLLDDVANSRSPIIRAMSNYHLALRDEDDGRFLLARVHSYRTLAALQVTDLEKYVPILKANTQYLIAKVLTRAVGAYFESEIGIPWYRQIDADPFRDRGESELRVLLNAGANPVGGSVLGDGTSQIVKGANTGRRWKVTCRKLSLEDVLQRFATKAHGGDIRWMNMDSPKRQRALSLSCRAVSYQELNEISCGMLGLVAQFTVDDVKVYDPQFCNSMSSRRDLLAREAEYAWRRFLMTHPEDKRVPEGRFSLGTINELANDSESALQVFASVHERFPQSAVAPLALLQSARIRMQLRDYIMAREDLRKMLDSYTDSPSIADAYMMLGEIGTLLGQQEEARNAFRQLYGSTLSPLIKQKACIGAARCLMNVGRYADAVKWLARYIKAARGISGGEVVDAHLLYGQAHVKLGNYTIAQEILERGIQRKPSDKQFVDLGLELMRVHEARKDSVSMLGVSGRIEPKVMNQEQMTEFLILTSRAYTNIGVPAVGRKLLGNTKYVSQIDKDNKPLRAEVGVALARCALAEGDLVMASKWLMDYWPHMRSGRAQWQAGLQLARLCLERGKAKQASLVAKELQGAQCPKDIRKAAKEVLVYAYVMQQQYAKAARSVPARELVINRDKSK